MIQKLHKALCALLQPQGVVRRIAMHVFAAGVITALTLPPYHVLVAFIAIAPLWFALRAATLPQAFLYGFLWYFGFHLLGLYWTAHALLTDPDAFAWLVPFAVTLIPAALGLSMGVAMVLYRKLYLLLPQKLLVSLLLFATCITAMDIAREYIYFNGFPWNPLATGLSWHVWLMQSAAYWGIYGLGFVVIVIACMIGHAISQAKASYGLLAIGLIVALVSFGAWRVHSYEAAYHPITVRIVQPNIQQHLKWNENTRRDLLLSTMQLAATPAEKTPNIIILPETGLPYALSQGVVPYNAAIAAAIPTGGTLITGAIWQEESASGHYSLYNALAALNEDAALVDIYKKMELVPFGEYIPFRQWLPLDKITYGSIDFSSGKERNLITPLNAPPALPLICYESIFSQGLRTGEAQWIVNITNDAWFGDSPGPYQHLAAMQWRAVESGLPAIRSANTGISAAINPLGKVTEHLNLFKTGFIDISLSKPIN